MSKLRYEATIEIGETLLFCAGCTFIVSATRINIFRHSREQVKFWWLRGGD
jgi:hypothetical protein